MTGIGLYIAVMATVTYCIRMVPFTLFRRKLHSPFVKSILYYLPYSVLGAMTIPGILYSAGSIPAAAAGLAAGLIAAFMEKSLLTVAAIACAAAYAMSLILSFLPV